MNKKLHMTEKFVKTLPIPEMGRDEWRDTRVHGLSIRVSWRGEKVWYVNRWDSENKRKVRWRIAGYPEMSLSEARRAAQVAIRKRLLSTEEELVGSMTFKEAYERYTSEHLATCARQKTIENYEQLMGTYLEPLWKTQMKCMANYQNRRKVQKIFDDISKYAPVAAIRAIELVRTVCRYFHKRCPEVGDATAWIDFKKEKAKRATRSDRTNKRWLKDGEVQLFSRACIEILGEERDDGVLAALVALLTGCRRSNVFQMEWSEIDLETGKWTIPAEKYKANFEHRVFLVEPLRTLLKERSRGFTDKYVFPADSRQGCMTDNRKALRRISERAGLSDKDMHMHALRRSFISHASLCTLPLAVLMRVSGHKAGGNITLDVYAQVDDKNVQDAFLEVAQRLLPQE